MLKKYINYDLANMHAKSASNTRGDIEIVIWISDKFS